MSTVLSVEEQLKFEILAEGVSVTAGALSTLTEATAQHALTPADYATTSGLILVLGNDVWVNAPIATFNPNFVTDAAPHVLDIAEDGHLVLCSRDRVVAANFWPPPAFHDETNRWGEPYTSYAFTHADRLRVSPVEGCAMRCQFCDLPYEFRYRRKRILRLIDALNAARNDRVQPAAHVLVSGGVPVPEDYGYLVESYHAVLDAADIPVDIMMVPIDQALPLQELADHGLNEVSVNIELFDDSAARRYMRMKFDQGRDHQLSFLAAAAEILGPRRVRSMLLVGIEPLEATLAGVRAVAERGCVPVLSPFRPDPSTPMGRMPAPSANFLEEAYLHSLDITRKFGVPLGPKCVPCSHNTLTLASTGLGDASRYYGYPHTV